MRILFTTQQAYARDVNLTYLNGVPCTDGLQTLKDLASALDDLKFEQAMECALFKKLVTIEELATLRPKRVQRVLKLRPAGAKPTESLLETLMVQLIRTDPRIPVPMRQAVVHNKWDRFVARIDLAWPDRGVFLELDGQGHRNQPEYDANRQTAIVAATGWLPGRFSWDEVTLFPKPTVHRVLDLLERADSLRISTKSV